MITIQNVSKIIGGNQILEEVSFRVKPNEHVGIIGRNGEGKTTIFDLIAGSENPDSGQIIRKKNMKISYAKQIPHFDGEKTASDFLEQSFESLLKKKEELEKLEQLLTENPSEKILQKYGEKQQQFIESGGYEIEQEIRRIARGLGFENKLQSSWKSLSGGEKRRVILAGSLLGNPELILLDEPTNHLDYVTIKWLASYLNNFKGGIICISHDRSFLDETITTLFELENRKIETYKINYSAYVIEREKRMLLQFESYNDQQKKIQKMKQAIKRFRQWGHEADNEAMFRKAKSIEKALDRMEKIEDPFKAEKNKANIQLNESKRSGKQVVIFEDVSHFFEEKELFFDVNFQINYGEKVALLGENGTGKSTIIRLIMQEIEPIDGIIHIGTQLKIAYLSQQMEELNMEKTVIETFRDKVLVDEFHARHMLASYLFVGQKVFQKVKYLSGGELMRLRLAWFVQSEVNFLIFDEPTNHLDIASREVLEESIQKFAGTVLLVSHDMYFIQKTCDKILRIDDKKVLEAQK